MDAVVHMLHQHWLALDWNFFLKMVVGLRLKLSVFSYAQLLLVIKSFMISNSELT